MTDGLHERFTEDATEASTAVVGANGARVWLETVKAVIVAETFDEGATVVGVTRRYGLSRTQLNGWRRMARNELLGPVAGAGDDALGLVPVTVSTASHAEQNGGSSMPADGIAIEIADLRVVVPPDFDATHLSRILVCVRAAL